MKCKECQIELQNKKNIFCSKSCAAKFNNASRKKPVKVNKKTGPLCYFGWCTICDKAIRNSNAKSCSDKCRMLAFERGGRKSASINVRRSKNEIKLFDLCKEQFLSVRHNEFIVETWDADIIIDDYKVAVLWNGPWHYQEMPLKNHSLLQVQTRDRIKVAKLIEAGWGVFIYEDRKYTPLSAFNHLINSIKPTWKEIS